ncbi:MAG: ribosome small subunit-dependent GTPase A [Myxococcales bacterium]|nr:ribosome small subunit-dependent GTPase A [Myxococcales bacterium]
MPSLRELGWTEFFQEQLEDIPDSSALPARVSIEHQDRYTIVGPEGVRDAHLTGRLLQEANCGGPRPATGDWIAAMPDGPICHVFRRKTAFQRLSPRGKLQVISANIDRVFIVTSCNAEFNIRRIERYLSAVSQSGAQPALVLTKIDLCDDPSAYRNKLGAIAGDTPISMVVTPTGEGLEGLEQVLGPGLSIALVGSSGVGKSTLANALMGEEKFATAAIRGQDAKGRHTTTRRELVLLPDSRGALIDTPGMRELQLSSDVDDQQQAFADILKLAESCQFRDCAHRSEPGCAVRGSVESSRLTNFQRIAQETRATSKARRRAQKVAHRGSTRKRSKKAGR